MSIPMKTFEEGRYGNAAGYSPSPDNHNLRSKSTDGYDNVPQYDQYPPETNQPRYNENKLAYGGSVPPNKGQQYPLNAGPIVNQPTVPLLPPGPGTQNCPPGLEYLMAVDQLLVKQKVELLEAFTGFETNNKFAIKNSLGQNVFFAVEDNDCCTRNCCGPARPFEMKIFDNYKNEVIHLNRPLACQSCCFPCCLQTIEITAPPGNLIGTIEQEWSLCSPSYRIKNERDETVLRIEGPFCTFSFCGDVEFQVVDLNGENIGKISKQWTGLAKELFTDADSFGINFPMNLDVRMKALLLGATFLIDVMFFENNN